MQESCLLTFHTTPERRAAYKEAAKSLGLKMSDIIRAALDAAVEKATVEAIAKKKEGETSG